MIFQCGGSFLTEETDDTYTIDMKSGHIEYLCAMSNPRQLHKIIRIKDKIFCAGGLSNYK